MGQKIEWSCDGCDDTQTTAFGKKPDNWHSPTVGWVGLLGHPSNLVDGEATFDLCGACSKRLAQQIKPASWPKPGRAKDEAAS